MTKHGYLFWLAGNKTNAFPNLILISIKRQRGVIRFPVSLYSRAIYLNYNETTHEKQGRRLQSGVNTMSSLQKTHAI